MSGDSLIGRTLGERFTITSFIGEGAMASVYRGTQSGDPGDVALKVMHGHLITEDGFNLMGADTPNSMEFNGQAGVSVSLSGDDEAKLRGYWDGLSEGGVVVMPFEQAPWGAVFGMVIDKFGTSWLVNCGDESR